MLQVGADRAGQPGDHRGEGFGGQQRFDEAQPRLEQVRREDRGDRLEHRAQRLVQPCRDQRAEAAGQRRARRGGQCADGLEAEQAQAVGDVGRQAQGLDRQGGEGGCRLADGDDRNDASPRAARPGLSHPPAVAGRISPCHRMRGAGRVGDRGTGGDPLGGQPADQVAQQPRLAAVQMRAAGDVDPDAVRRIGARSAAA